MNSPILAVSTLTDPYILEQAYDADEAVLEEQTAQTLAPYVTATQYIDTAPTHELRRILHALTFSSPEVKRFINYQIADALTDDAYCPDCDREPCICDEEPPEASEVTGYDNGPTYW